MKRVQIVPVRLCTRVTWRYQNTEHLIQIDSIEYCQLTVLLTGSDILQYSLNASPVENVVARNY